MSSTLNQLSSASSLSVSDLLLIFSNNNGDSRKVSAQVLAEFIAGQITGQSTNEKQYAAPNATAFNVQINPTQIGNDVWLILTPTGTFAAGTITLPAIANLLDQQELLVNCTQIVTALTVTGNGATVNGAPTTLAANGFFRLKFDKITGNWYRV